MKTAPVIAVLALGAAATTAQAEVSSTITLASDYDFRGITQTARDPALQASLDWSTESGFYLGAWASNVDFGDGTESDFELDLLGGLSGNFSDDVGYDIGLARYNYFANGDDIDYTEYYLSLSFKALSVKYWYSSDFVNSGDGANYLEANVDVPLPNDFTATLHVGRSGGAFWADDKYTDYSVGVSKTVGNFDLGLKWVDGSDFKPGNNIGDANSSESRVIFTVATTLPWGK
ncbi:MAG: TorF family putative porin [Gammaproteobacteria bacterium]